MFLIKSITCEKEAIILSDIIMAHVLCNSCHTWLSENPTVLPRRCPGCDKLTRDNTYEICPDCGAKFGDCQHTRQIFQIYQGIKRAVIPKNKFVRRCCSCQKDIGDGSQPAPFKCPHCRKSTAENTYLVLSGEPTIVKKPENVH
jgi:predicted RNA-binding Zn-ribbon protein involved in translation (DUF1610 family)